MAFHIVFVLFDGITQLDFTAPAQVLARVPDARVTTAAASTAPIQTGCGFSIVPTATFSQTDPADLLCVPGGAGVADALGDPATIDFVTAQAAGARYVTSVCTGAFVLGAAGLLRGKRATTHWVYTDLLSLVGAEYVPDRVVVDGTTITGGGVTAGLDFALTVVAHVAGPERAQSIQLSLEYDPAPPFTAGNPERAPESVRRLMTPHYQSAAERMRDALSSAVRKAP